MWGKREIIYLSLHCHHQNDSCIKMGSDGSHLNVSVGSVGQSHRTVSTNPNLFEEKGEPKRVSNRGPSAYQPNALPLGHTGSQASTCVAGSFKNKFVQWVFVCVCIIKFPGPWRWLWNCLEQWVERDFRVCERYSRKNSQARKNSVQHRWTQLAKAELGSCMPMLNFKKTSTHCTLKKKL